MVVSSLYARVACVLQGPPLVEPLDRSVAALFLRQTRALGDQIFWHEPNLESDSWSAVTWNQFYLEVRAMAGYLLDQGYSNQDCIAFLAPRSRALFALEMACACLGIPCFHFHEQRSKVSVFQILQQAGATRLVLGGASEYHYLFEESHLKMAMNDIGISSVVLLRPELDPMGDLVQVLRPDINDLSDDVFLAKVAEVGPDTPLGILTTSGTTGLPKGVMLSHYNVLVQRANQRQIMGDLLDRPRILSYLPWTHNFGRYFDRLMVMYNGGTYFLDDSAGKNISRMIANIAKARPTALISVPVILARLAAAGQQDKATAAIICHPELRFVFCGAAKLDDDTARFFREHHVPVFVGYGLSESSGGLVATRPEFPPYYVPGIVGQPLPGVTIRLTACEDGGAGRFQIEAKGPNIALGYTRTALNLTDDGFLRTGDLGEIREERGQRYLVYAGRADDVFKLTNGLLLAPHEIETSLNSFPGVEASMISGDGCAQIGALLFLNYEFLKTIFSEQPELSNPRVIDYLRSIIERYNRETRHKFHKIDRVLLTLEQAPITGTNKIQRSVCRQRYGSALQQLQDMALPNDGIIIQAF